MNMNMNMNMNEQLSYIRNNNDKKSNFNKELSEKIKIIDLFATKFVENIINALAKILIECGITVNLYIRGITNADIRACINDRSRYMFICCPQTLIQAVNGPVYPTSLNPLPTNKYFLYQLEQLDINNPKVLNPHIISLILKSKHTFDYSDANISYYPSEVKYKVSNLLPPLVESPIYTSSTLKTPGEYKTSSELKTIDVLFCGHINERRNSIIKFLQLNRINIVIKSNVFGEELTTLISRAKIFLNIRYNNNSDVLEICRLHEAVMSTTTHIVSEPVKNKQQIELYKDRIIFSNNLLFTIKELLRGYAPVNHVTDNNVCDYSKWINYSQIKYFTTAKLFKTLEVEYNNKKLLHRHNCYENLTLIRNVLIPDIVIGSKYETVLIEFRPMPHLEFLLRNTIIKFPNWSHTVVCGNLNYEFMQTMCKNISKDNINIIHLNIDNLTPSDYSKLLMTSDFWNNFKGEKILLYQEDSMLFHNRIEEFMYYDYVGASWSLGQDDNARGVGNGGFSLRTKAKMLECLEKVNPYTDLKLGKSTIDYMKNTNSYIIPEDVYFSKSLIDYKLGSVPTRYVANRFSQETQLCVNPLGGHNFWLAKDNKLQAGITLQLETDYYNTVTHRGGWKNIITSLINSNIVFKNIINENENKNKNKNIVKLIDCVESRFIWNKNSDPMMESWIGIIHYSPYLPTFMQHTLDYVLNNPTLIQSLTSCKGLIVFSKSSEKYIKKQVAYRNINIISMKHPCETIKNKFNLENYLKLNDYSVIQLGQQDRKLTTIYTLNTNKKKIWLSGSVQKEKTLNALQEEINFLNLKNININLVEMPYFTNHMEYDNMLQNNIIIIPLWGASANNSIMEIIEMNVPAFVTRLPATEEYLGKDYPMFYTENNEIENIINDHVKLHNKFKETYNYLLNMDKKEFTLDYFKSELVKFCLMN
jgi:hypothetical protein